MKELERELNQYKRMNAELAHENYALKHLIEKKCSEAAGQARGGAVPGGRAWPCHHSGNECGEAVEIGLLSFTPDQPRAAGPASDRCAERAG